MASAMVHWNKQPRLSPVSGPEMQSQVLSQLTRHISASNGVAVCGSQQRMFAAARCLMNKQGWVETYSQGGLGQGARLGDHAAQAMPELSAQLEECPANEGNADALRTSAVGSVGPSDGPLGRIQTERGTQFVVGPSFYKPESTPSRDLAVLAALVYKRQSGGPLRVLDVMSGCGVRGARYLDQAGADFVWANDAWDETHGPLVANLSAASGDPWGFQGPVDAWQTKHASASVEGAASAGPGGEGAEWAERQESHSRASTTGDVRAEGDDDRQNVGGGKWKSEGHLSPGMRGENGRDRLEGAACNESESEGSQHEDDSESAATRQHTRSQNGHAGLGEAASGTDVDPLPEVQGPQREPRWRVSHLEATKLLNSCNQNDDFYDIVDIDSFGSDSAFLGDALRAVRFGGMVYATSTDGFALAGGHRPAATLAAYGSYARPVPFGNELGLRILVGTMVREGAMRNLLVRPLFSHFAPHGPVFRAMLRVDKLNKGDWGHDDFAFLGHCFVCGQSRKAAWKQLGNVTCSCAGPEIPPRPMAVVGPLWTGPLHCAAFVDAMVAESARHSWVQGLAEGYGRRPAGERFRPKGNSVYPFRDLPDLLALMREETQPGLHPFFYKLDDIYKLGRTSPVNKLELCAELRKAGFVVSRSHVSAGAIKTDASMSDCIEAAKACLAVAQKRKEEKLAAKR